MTKIDVYSGFLGAGKTTLIKKLIQEYYSGQKIVLIENEFGEIGIDGDFLQDAGIEITQMNSGCICCSLVGDFSKALKQVIEEYAPDRVLIEPSGVGKLSDVIAAAKKVTNENVTLGYSVAVVDASKVKVYMKNFGEFYNNQVETASAIILSRTDSVSQDKLDKAIALLRERNATATIVTTPWSELSAQQLVEAMEGVSSVAATLDALKEEHHHHEEHCGCGCHEGHHHHEEHHHDDHCDCGCHAGHHHHHPHHEEEHCCEHHEHHHEHHHHDSHCDCGCHDEHHHHHEHGHHHADDVFHSWGVETARKFTVSEVKTALESFDVGKCGTILRAKGVVCGKDGSWIHFDYVPGESDVRTGSAAVNGKICVIGTDLAIDVIADAFGI